MINKKLGFFLFAGTLSMIVSCTQDTSGPTLGKGSFRPSVTTNSEVVPVLRSVAENSDVIPDVDQFHLKLRSEDGSYSREWSSINNVAPDELYNVGNYVLSATYGSIDTEGFDTPYYVGETAFAIRDKETTPVEVVCTLGQVKLSLQYTESFTSYFAAYKATVRSSTGKELLFDNTETRDAYLHPGDITLKLALTKPNGISATYEPAKIKDAKAREHYIVTFDVSENAGEAVLTVVFDNETEVEPITINVSDEAMVAPAPYILLDGVENGGTIKIQEYSEPQDSKLSASIIARGGVAGCTLTTQSAYLQSLGGPAVAELTELTPDADTLFDALGLEMKGLEANRDVMGIINFAPFASSLQIAADGDNIHTFTLTAKDNNGKVSESVSFTIENLPLTLAMGEIADVMLGSTTVDIPITFNGSDLSRLKVLQHNGEEKVSVPYIIQSKDGDNYVLRAEVEMENKPQTLSLSYLDYKVTEPQEVDVILPEYSIAYNPYDIWATYAVMTVTATDEAYQDVVEKYLTFYVNVAGEWTEKAVVADGNRMRISGLSTGSSYGLKTSLRADAADLEDSKIINITTESALGLPNSDFEAWTQWYSATINKGGQYRKSLGSLTQETANLQSLNPNGWATVNSKTVPTSPSNKNTWYMTPSTLPVDGASGSAALLRNVAWDNNGSTPPAGNKWGIGSQSLSDLNAPTIGKRSAGKMFLGSYSYDHSTGVELYNEGIGFSSRPSKLVGQYKYVANGNDAGLAIVTVEHRAADGQTITLATNRVELPAMAGYTYFEVPLSYTNTQYKATHIKVMFASSRKASQSQQEESNSITTVNNAAEAVSLGSELYIDNITLKY